MVLTDTNQWAPVDFPQIIASTTNKASAHAQTPRTTTQPRHIDDIPVPQAPQNTLPSQDNTRRFLCQNGKIQPLQDVERDLIAFALEFNDGAMTKTAKSLGIGRSTLYRKLKEYGLEPDQSNEAA
ncbi:MAG: sigma-54-dependent Fis family transcriptional regulator, partial [Devosiaceae bacterium]|nr:sigma-54-dependent Fis family transcriptional regulator [Devosiaceae bacterium]